MWGVTWHGRDHRPARSSPDALRQRPLGVARNAPNGTVADDIAPGIYGDWQSHVHRVACGGVLECRRSVTAFEQ